MRPRIEPPARDPAPLALAIAGLFAMAGAMGIGRFIYTPILPPMVEALGQSKTEAGLIASANFLGYLAGAIAAGSRHLPGSQRATLIAALATSAATTAAMAWPSDLAAFMVLRALGGVASAFVLVFSSALIVERLVAAGRPELSTLHLAGVGTGIALSALLTAGLAAAGLGWRTMWLAGGMLAALALVVVVALVPARDGRPPPEISPSGGFIGGALLRLTIGYGLFGLGYVVTATFIVAIVRGTPELTAIEPYVWLVLGLAAIPSIAAWVAVGRRVGIAPAFAAACLVEAAGVALSVLSRDPLVVLAAAGLLGATFMGITALGFIAARDLAPAAPRRAMALLTAAFGVGQIIGPPIAGYAFDVTGSFLVPSLMAAAALVVAAGLTATLPPVTRPPAAGVAPAPAQPR